MKQGYVTGATGCVGRNLVNELIKENWNIVILHRKSSDISRLKGLKVSFQEVDLYDLSSVRKSIPINVDAIFHVAGNTSHWSKEAPQQWKDNVLATRNLVQVALENKVKRFIFTSTGATLPYQMTNEKSASAIHPPYVKTKRLAEIEVYAGIEKGLDAVVLHPIIVVGAYDYNSYSQIFLNFKKSPINFAFPGRIAFCHAEDVAIAHIQAFKRGKSGEHYVLGGTYTTWLEVFQKIATTVGASTKVRLAPQWLLKLTSYMFVFISIFTNKKPLLTPELVNLLHDAPDVTKEEKRKAQEELGYESRSLDAMIDDCYTWLLSEKLMVKSTLFMEKVEAIKLDQENTYPFKELI